MTYRERIAERLENLPWMAPPIREPRGVVTVAGGPLYFALWWHLVYALRDLGCRLPLELWTVRADELDAGMYAAARDLGATVIDAQAHAQAHGNVPPAGGWQCKAYAMRHSGFAEVIYLDADNVPVVDPTYLLMDKHYLRTGAIYWPDLPPPRQRAEWVPTGAWQAVGLEPVRSARPFESGQMVVDRRRHLAALDVALLMNEMHAETYRFVYGDKDTFLLASHLTQTRYSMPPRNPVWSAPAINQHDMAGSLVFQHACQGKDDIVAGRILKSIINRRYAPDARASLARTLPHLVT
jgi:hypothetical protein